MGSAVDSVEALSGAATEVDSWVSAHWASWSQGRRGLTYRCALKGTRQDRMTLFYFARESRSPDLVVKIAGDVGERVPAQAEFRALTQVRSALRLDAFDLAPEALGLHRGQRYSAVALTPVPGRRIALPLLTRRSPSVLERRATLAYFRMADTVSRQLGTSLSSSLQARPLGALSDQLASFRSLGSVSDQARERLSALEQRVATATGQYTPSWQHGDVAPGNLLVSRSGPRLIDWEAAGPHHQPWFDAAYSWLTIARLTQRQGSDWSASRALAHLHGEEGWLGRRLARETQRGWDHELPHRWAATFVAVELALTYGQAGQAAWSPYVEAMLTDDSVRSRCTWMVPSPADLGQ